MNSSRLCRHRLRPPRTHPWHRPTRKRAWDRGCHSRAVSRTRAAERRTGDKRLIEWKVRFSRREREQQHTGGRIIRLGEPNRPGASPAAVRPWTGAEKVGVPPSSDKDKARHVSKPFISPVACTSLESTVFIPIFFLKLQPLHYSAQPLFPCHSKVIRKTVGRNSEGWKDATPGRTSRKVRCTSFVQCVLMKAVSHWHAAGMGAARAAIIQHPAGKSGGSLSKYQVGIAETERNVPTESGSRSANHGLMLPHQLRRGHQPWIFPAGSIPP